MADSVKLLQNEHSNRIHSQCTSGGRIHKGHNVVAATASIPSKYQTVVTDNSDSKGFLSQSRRFNQELVINDNPGPGHYIDNITLAGVDNVSFSKKGTGTFASKSRRQVRYIMSNAPGPGTYTPVVPLNSRKDFNQSSTTSVFHKPIAEVIDKESTVPAPNQYQMQSSVSWKRENAAFKSRTQRDVMDSKEMKRVPAPGQYNVNDDLLHDSAKAPVSSFKSKTERNLLTQPPEYPGPGTYKPFEAIDPAKKQLFPRRHYLCISAPAMPLPALLPQPGPGQYDVVDYDGEPKHYMSSSMFVSSSSRWTGDHRNIAQPGPAHYRPLHVGKQSFIYNSACKWI